MGEVYRAIDTRLNRQVAIKILPEAHANDSERIARFHREAQAVAALNHSSIAAIYELAEHGAVRYLVLELIEGETLADRLKRGPLPVEEALRVAQQILEALEIAHDKGICHRDLKPANIKLTPDGSIKVLDFGLAKFLQAAPVAGNMSHSPTLSLAGTLPGVILGTAAYMSPEQAKGFEADQRSDIFSFGCIFYELLTGRAAFDGETASEILASVLKSDVDFSLLPPRLDPRLTDVLRRCLEKNPKKRWHSAADVRVEIESLMGRALVADEPRPVVAAVARPLWQRVTMASLIALVVAGLAGYAGWTLKPYPQTRPVRFRVLLPEGEQFTGTTRRIIDISADGSKLLYVANNRIYVRDVDALEPRVIALDDAPNLGNPTFSPDGLWIAYTTIAGPTGHLRRVAANGGAPLTLCEVNPTFGMRWDADGIILGQGTRGIVRISPTDGSTEVIAAAGPDEMLGSPQILPGGRTVVYAVKKAQESWENARIVAQPLGGGERKVIVPAGSDGRFLSSGHLAYMGSGVLFAVPFDPRTLEATAAPIPVVEGVRASMANALSGSAQLSISAAGSVAYVPGPITARTPGFDLALFDRKGNVQPLKLPPARYVAPRVSRDGRFVAYDTDDGKESVVWVYELAGGTIPRRLTFVGNNRMPVWSPSGEWLAFQSDREGDRAAYRQRADGTGVAERLAAPERGSEHIPEDWSRDGERLLIAIRKTQETLAETTLAVLTLKDRKLEPVPDTQSSSFLNAAFSPDGKWIAYQGIESSVLATYVQPFPATGVKYQGPRSNPGTGTGHPLWSPKGNELILTSGVGRSLLIPVRTTPTFGFGQPGDWPRGGRSEPNPTVARRASDIMPDGQHLIGLLPSDTRGGPAPNELIVVLNWFNELRQRVPN